MNREKLLKAGVVIKTLIVVSALAIGIILINGNKNTYGGGKEQVSIGNQSASATTTYLYLTTSDSASTTAIANVGSAASFDFNVCATASSSVAQLDGSLWFTMDENTNPTWFQATNSTVDSATSLSFDRYDFNLSLATTSLGTNYTCQNVLTSPIGAKKVMVKMGVSGANTGLWWQIAPKIGL